MIDRRRARMKEDRYLRDSARALVEADLQHLRGGLQRKGLGERALDRVRDGAADIYEEALEVAADHKGALVALLAAIAVWFARHPIFSLLGFHEESDGEEE